MTLPKPPTPRIRLNPISLSGSARWICSLKGAKLNIGYGKTPKEAYDFWHAKHGTRELVPQTRAPRPRSFNSDDRL